MGNTPLFRSLRRSLYGAAATQNIGRRTFLRNSGGLVGIAAVAAPLAACGVQEPAASRRSYDRPIAIVGAGLAGLTAAWELAKADIPFTVYEASSRIGGRVWTLRDFNASGQFVELGAELVDSDHTDLKSLCAELGIAVEPFDDAGPGLTKDAFHFRGTSYTKADFDTAVVPLLRAVERAQAHIQGRRKELAVSWDDPQNGAKYDRVSLAEFLAQQTDVADWLREMVRIAYVGELGREIDEQSSLNLILLMNPKKAEMFGDSDECCRIAGGSSALVNALREAILRRTGRSADSLFRTRHELVALRQPDSELQLVFDQDGTLQAVNAERTVLALPFTLLRRVAGIEALPLHERKKRSIQEYGYGTNSKIMSDFRQRIWRQPGGTLPAFDTSLTSDGGPQTFWDTSRKQAGANGILTNFLGGKAGAAAGGTAARSGIEYLTRLDLRFGQAFTGRQRTMNWTNYRWSQGSYSCPLVGQYTAFFGIEGRSELDGRLLFAGEHTSVESSGFMNGAVESGVRVAREITQPARRAA